MIVLEPSHIRNFSIIAHIDHGKSTLADRLLELTGTVESRKFSGHSQLLDTMDLEQEKGVTIKASAVQLNWTARDGETYELNLIDTPGHVDFGYEVSRALAACEGALVIDATQGIEAQTLANLYLALENDLEIIPVINKIDLVTADVPRTTREICDLLGVDESDVIAVSAKDGTNVEAVLEAVVARVPPPSGTSVEAPLQALVFDSHYDSYRGVIAYVRVYQGQVSRQTELLMMATRARTEPVEVGVFRPDMTPVAGLSAGEVGYIATGFKSVREARVGDTVTNAKRPASDALQGISRQNQWCSPAFTPRNPRTTRICAMHSPSCSSMMRHLRMSLRPRRPCSLGFAVAFSACSIWKSLRSVWSASTGRIWS